ncbi:hypothetical protein J4E91_006981 [Alternaria rosae]|nr:hypothetical protein J4E91_006981 [Alternaria rosae]
MTAQKVTSASLSSAKLAEPPSDRDRTSATDRAADRIAESPRTVKEDVDGDDMSGENKDTVEGTLEEREEAETVEEYKDTTPNLHEIKQEPGSVAPGVTTASPKAPITADDPPATQSLFEPKDDTNEGSEFVFVEDEAVKAAWKKFVEKLTSSQLTSLLRNKKSLKGRLIRLFK